MTYFIRILLLFLGFATSTVIFAQTPQTPEKPQLPVEPVSPPVPVTPQTPQQPVIPVANTQKNDTTRISRKSYEFTRVTTQPVIDGEPFEDFWKDIPEAHNFIQLEPTNGVPERDTHKTVVKVAYDNNALYVAGYMYDNEPERILRQFSQRDDINAQADIFGFYLNTYNNQINQTRFFATSANSFGDAIVENSNEDFTYNVVFSSEASIDGKGWYVEMKIPYRTLRFPEIDVQNWSFNAYRRIRHLNEEYTFNFVDITLGNATQYDAIVTGVKDIKPPLRLNLYPYASVISNFNNGVNETVYNAGMDIKYGISDSFTLDATLIPDFGQVAFDAVELNLGPFEQVFGENRAFFTEGTDLFSKGDLFFSRRIGQRPTGAGNLNLVANEEIVKNPELANLLNSVKVTGRTKDRLGIGVLNAITERTEAKIRNMDDGTVRNKTTEPLTNYNVLVFDQQFGQNSSVFITNTSTLRNGSFTDALATAVGTNLNNSKGSQNLRSEFKLSNRFTPTGTVTGVSTENVWRKTSGNWRPTIGHFFTSKDYNINDLGVNFRNDFHTFQGDMQYVQFTPQGIFNRWNVNYRTRHRRVASTGIHTGTTFEINPFFFTRERFAFGATANYSTASKDQFESRIPNLLTRYNSSVSMNGFISSDFRKRFALDARVNYFSRFNDDEVFYSYNINPRFRFSDKFLLIYSFNWTKSENRDSFVALVNNSQNAILSARDMHTLEHNMQGNYNFDNRQAISLSFRNFWSRASFSTDFQQLNNDGILVDSTYTPPAGTSPDANFNIWNVDLAYRLRIGWGSELTLLYRNSIFNRDSQGSISYQESLNNLLQQPANHNISLRFIYFIDFNDTKEWINSI